MKAVKILACVGMILFVASAAHAQEADSIKVNRVAVCTAVVDREPSGEGTEFDTTTPILYCFTELDGGTGEVTHAWFQGDSLRSEVKLNKGGEGRWRTWSSKTMPTEMTGSWKVEIRDDSGNVLQTASFTFGSTE